MTRLQSSGNVRVNTTAYRGKRIQTMERFYINAVIPLRACKTFSSSNLQHFQAIAHNELRQRMDELEKKQSRLSERLDGMEARFRPLEASRAGYTRTMVRSLDCISYSWTNWSVSGLL